MISTQILDLETGLPASGVFVKLEKFSEEAWKPIDDHPTDDDGRIQFDCSQQSGIYRLSFQIEEYQRKSRRDPFFIVAPVVFHIIDTERNYHIPLLLSSFGYSTYRGS